MELVNFGGNIPINNVYKLESNEKVEIKSELRDIAKDKSNEIGTDCSQQEYIEK